MSKLGSFQVRKYLAEGVMVLCKSACYHMTAVCPLSSFLLAGRTFPYLKISIYCAL